MSNFASIGARSLATVVAACTVALVVLAERAHALQDAATFYRDGSRAYQEDRYVDAVRFLYAYEVLSGSAEATARVRPALEYAVARLNLAVVTKQQLDSLGEVQRIEVSATGSADEWRASTRMAPWRPPPKPRPLNRRKPDLAELSSVTTPTPDVFVPRRAIEVVRRDSRVVDIVGRATPVESREVRDLLRELENRWAVMIEQQSRLKQRCDSLKLEYRRLRARPRER